jgi:hypothetical protein
VGRLSGKKEDCGKTGTKRRNERRGEENETRKEQRSNKERKMGLDPRLLHIYGYNLSPATYEERTKKDKAGNTNMEGESRGEKKRTKEEDE